MLPCGLQRAGHETVLRFHGPVTPFRPFALIAGPLYLEAPLGARGFMIHLYVLFGEQCGLETGRADGIEKNLHHRCIDPYPSYAQAAQSPAVDQRVGCAIVPGVEYLP